MDRWQRQTACGLGESRVRDLTPGAGAFTLVELLVSVAIVVVLAALAFAMFKRVRDAADKAVVVQDLAQLQVANTQCASDHSGNYIPYLVNDADGKRAAYWYQVPDFLTCFRGGKAIVVYFDGHVGEMTRSDIAAIDDKQGGQNSAFWKPAQN